MLKEIFIGRVPSHFKVNNIVKAFIVSETFLWSAWNFVAPIIAIFAVANIPGGNVEVAASSYSAHLITRVIFELTSGRYLLKASELKKFLITILGMIFVTLGYISFAMTQSVPFFFISYAIIGVGLGIATPAKNSLFSTHLDKNKEPVEWGMYDATVFMGMALSAALGGFIAKQYGFQLLFFLAASINTLGLIPYILYIHKGRKSS